MIKNLKIITVLLITWILIGSCAFIKQTPQTNKKTKVSNEKITSKKSSDSSLNSLKPFNEIITDKAITQKGLLVVHRVNDKVYLEIKDSILNRDLLIVNRIEKGAVDFQRPAFGNLGYAGDEIGENVVQFNKGPKNKILLRRISFLEVSRDTSANGVYKGVNNSNFPPIVAAFDIKAVSKDSTGYVIDITDYLNSDNDVFFFDPEVKKLFGLGAVQSDKSYISEIKSFPLNTEIHTVKTYVKDLTFNTYGLNSSVILLPSHPMQPRFSDSRLGYFAVEYRNFDDPKGVSIGSLITRWRLEPRDEDIKRYEKGELVEPKHPIVYYIDPAFPKKWVPYLIQGVNDWQKAFEKAGFKHAIYALEAPVNDPDWSLEDARHNAIVYKPGVIANANGPNVHDPRTGEIIETHINWYHNVIQLLHDWYMVQAGLSDPKGRKMVFDDALMGRLIRFAISHEVGHTLGLTHNFRASSTVPVDSLRSKHYLDLNGISPSIMDYARFDYVAQPKDSIPENDLIGRIGAYDRWAIEWGYKWFSTNKSEADEKAYMNRWIIQRLTNHPELSYATFDLYHPSFDPRTQSEDLGDNAMQAGRYGISNLKKIMRNILSWTADSNADYSSTKRIQAEILNQYSRYINHVDGYIAGVMTNNVTQGQGQVVYQFPSKNTQRDAVKFLQEELFTTPTWLMDKKLFPYTSYGGVLIPIFFQRPILFSLMSITNFENLSLFKSAYPEKAYTYDQLLNDLEDGIWKELKRKEPIDVYRRDLQKAYAEKLINVFQSNTAAQTEFTTAPTKNFTDVYSIARSHTRKLIVQINRALPYYNGLTKDHLLDVRDRLQNSLNIQKIIEITDPAMKPSADKSNRLNILSPQGCWYNPSVFLK